MNGITAKWTAGIAFAGAVIALATGAAAQTAKIVIKGSNTFGEELAPALIEKYRKKHPDVSFELESKGSASGFAALLAGECDIASSSRTINDDEKRLAQSRGIKLNDKYIGSYGVAVILHPANPVNNLTDKQIRDIFTGAITNWKAVGGKDLPIQLYIRDPVSGTNLGFRELAMENTPYAASAKAFQTYGEIVAVVKSDEAGIGYASMLAENEKGLKTARINGKQITIWSVNEGRYPYARSLRLYTNKNRESPEVKDFLRFVITRPGQDVLQQLGFVRRSQPPLWSPDF
jgi:phosphate transport system substrate-binding protein